ncbi:DELTA-actitoxin-Afr1a-like [Trematomus bernacchii]|uniref:DELTA-actitoxin-Afr1a-like n=1 Tax=Trematomus bernacchii TaxID=40690 RepID=UPI00146A31F6|nr:DELTA-actitoxin-Afr1a-like [Trematomus bernacchii]
MAVAIVGAAAALAAAVAAIGQILSEVIPTHRQCDIEIVNDCTTYTLCNPRRYTSSGYCTTLSQTVAPLSSGNASFQKNANTALGAVGVFTYDLLNNSTSLTDETIAVMFSVPYDYNWYSNWYAVGVFNKSIWCDYDLYDEMYNHTEIKFVRGKASGNHGLTYKGKQVTIIAGMSNTTHSVMKMHVMQN